MFIQGMTHFRSQENHKWTFMFLLLWEGRLQQSNQSRLDHYWNSYAVYSTTSKAEPLPSVLLQIPVTNSTVNGTISGLDFVSVAPFTAATSYSTFTSAATGAFYQNCEHAGGNDTMECYVVHNIVNVWASEPGG